MQVEGIANLLAARILNAAAMDVNSLEGIDVASLPNRSLCLVRENEGLYRYFEESAAPPVPPNVVRPAPGGVPQDGRWLLVSSGGGTATVGPFETAVVPSASRLADADTTPLPNGTSAEVVSMGASWVLDKTSTATADNITIVAPAFGPGRWFRVPGYSRRWTVQASWFIDPAGSDENDGATALRPLATFAELSRRISGGSIAQTTTVTLAAGTYGVELDLTLAAGVFFIVQGAVTQTATGTLSAVTNSVPLVNPGVSTRGAITNTGGDPAFVDRTRLRLTSGANAGALAWVTRVIAADNVNVSRWARTDPVVTTLPTVGNASVGNTYVVESFVSTFDRVNVTCRGSGRIIVRECVITGAGVANRCRNDAGTLGGVYFYSCLFNGSSSLWYQGEGLFVSCAFQASVTVFQNAYMSLRANVFTGVGGLTLDGGAVANLARSNCFDASPITVHTAWLQFTGSPGDCEFSDQTLASITVWPGGIVDNDSGCILWGADNSTANTLVVRSLSPGIAPAALNLLNIPGGTNDTIIGGTATAYGALPFYNTARGCGIVLRA